MTTNVRNNQQVEMLKGTFVPRNDPILAWSRAISSMQLLPGLRGLWGMGSVDETGAVYDHSGQGRTLTNNSATQFGVYNNLVPYMIGDGSADYLSRADAAGTSITGALTLYAWVWTDAIPPSGNRHVIGQYAAAPNRSYRLYLTNSGSLRGAMSTNGTTEVAVSSDVPLVANIWFHQVLRYTPSTELAVFINGIKKSNTSSIPATIFDGSVAFTIGAQATPDENLDGRATLCGLYAAVHSDAAIQSVYHSQRSIFSHH